MSTDLLIIPFKNFNIYTLKIKKCIFLNILSYIKIMFTENVLMEFRSDYQKD